MERIVEHDMGADSMNASTVPAKVGYLVTDKINQRKKRVMFYMSPRNEVYDIIIRGTLSIVGNSDQIWSELLDKLLDELGIPL